MVMGMGMRIAMTTVIIMNMAISMTTAISMTMAIDMTMAVMATDLFLLERLKEIARQSRPHGAAR